MANDEEYVYEVIENENDARICAQLISDEFAEREPTTQHEKMTSKSFFEKAALPTTMGSFREGLSFLVRHRSSGEIVGTVVANDFYTAYNKHPDDPSTPSAWAPIFDILHELDYMFVHHDFGQELKPQMVLHICLGATKVEHAGKGIATRLRQIACKHARDEKGYQYAVAQATNPATRHIYLTKMAGKILREIDSTTWIWKKQGDGKSIPYKDFKDRPIPLILMNLKEAV